MYVKYHKQDRTNTYVLKSKESAVSTPYYCVTSWSQPVSTVIKPLIMIYNQSLTLWTVNE